MASRKAASASRAGEPTGAREPESIEVRFLGRIRENLVGVLHFLVGGLGLFVAGVAVWVVLLGKLAVRLLDIVRAGRLGDAEDFVGIAGHVQSNGMRWWRIVRVFGSVQFFLGVEDGGL